MRVVQWIRIAKGWGVVAGALVAAGCAGETLGERVRSATYPPDFEYVTKKDVDSSMAKLAVDVQELNRLLRGQATALDATRKAEIVAVLERIQANSSALDSPSQRSNHPLIDSNLRMFREDVERALLSAKDDPPNYFLAGSVAGSCMYCHGGGARR